MDVALRLSSPAEFIAMPPLSVFGASTPTTSGSTDYRYHQNPEKMELIADQIMNMIQQEDRAYYNHRHDHMSQPAVLVEYHENHHHHHPPSLSSSRRRERQTTEPPLPSPSSTSTSTSSSVSLKPSSLLYRKDTFDSTESTWSSHSNISIDQVCDIDVIMTQHHNSHPPPQYKVTSAPCYPYSHSLCYAYLNHSPRLQHQFRHPSPYSGYFDGVTRSLVSSSSSPSLLQVQSTASFHSLPLSPAQVEFWRQQMYDWCCLVVDAYHLHRECVTMTFNLLDRYIRWYLFSNNSKNAQGARWNPITRRLTPVIVIITRDDYQLWCMTCLYLAIKLLMGVTSTGRGRSTTKITVGALARMSKNYYSPDIIERTELDIAYGLNWYLHAPTSTSYVRLLWQFVSLSVPRHHHQHDRMEQTAHDITELAIFRSYFSQEKAIDIALASIHLALRIQQQMDHSCHNIHDDGQANMVLLDVYWTVIMHHFPILQQKQDCPKFQGVYQELATVNYLMS